MEQRKLASGKAPKEEKETKKKKEEKVKEKPASDKKDKKAKDKKKRRPLKKKINKSTFYFYLSYFEYSLIMVEGLAI